MRLAGALALLLVLAGSGVRAQGADKVIDVRAAQPPAGNSFEALWAAYKRAEQKGDAEGRAGALREIRRLRIERNIRSLEPLALARVGEGVARLKRGDRGRAEEEFRGAAVLDPHLPDAHFGLALTQLQRGPLGLAPAARDTLSGVLARLRTVDGRHQLRLLLVPVTLLAALATALVVAGALVLRYGALLRHDLEESLGPGRRGLAVTLCLAFFLLPALAFQGWAWLPFWALALLLVYMTIGERAAIGLLLTLCVAAGPLLRALESRVLARQNPLFQAGLLSIEGGPDPRAMVTLESAMRQQADDRDLLYLLAAQHRKAGRYDDAASLYRELLRLEPKDRFALNNLANLEFAAGEFPAAIARYKQGIESSPSTEATATFYYNLSLAHLQRFEYQPAQEARSQAERLASGLIRSYDAWRYEKGDYAVVDLSLTPDELWGKFAGTPQGVRVKNVAGRAPATAGPLELGAALRNRFTAFLAVFLVVVVAVAQWRGRKTFTRRCVKCGTPFCRRCQLVSASAGLCTQCYHLFVVRDGVAGPARNKKLLEVQKEEERRDRIFRVLSLLSPGAGHLYGQRTLFGLTLVFVWALLLALVVLGGRVLPLTDASSLLTKPWGLALAAALLLVIYVAGNRGRPEYEVAMPVGRMPPRRGRAA